MNLSADREKKLLILAYAFPPQGVVGAMRPLRMCKYLRKYTDWSPIVLTVGKRFARSDNGLLAEIAMSGVEIYRAPIFEPIDLLENMARKVRALVTGNSKESGESNSVASRRKTNALRANKGVARKFKDVVFEAFSTPDHAVFWNLVLPFYLVRIIKKERVDALLVTSPPWSTQISGCVVKKKLGVPWIADLRDPWTDIKRGAKSPWATSLEIWMERQLLSQANCVISTSETYTESLREKYPFMDGSKFTTLHNGYDDEKFTKARIRNTRKFTVVHLGSLYSMMDPHFFFKAFEKWLSDHPLERDTIELVFVGEIDKVTANIIEELRISDVVRVTGFLPHEQAVDVCLSSDLLILLLGTTSVTPGGWIPSKLFEYIGCNRPILGVIREGEAAALIRKTRSGYVITDQNEKAVCQVLEELFRRKIDKAQGRVEWQNDPGEMNYIKQRFLMQKLGMILDRTCGFHK